MGKKKSNKYPNLILTFRYQTKIIYIEVKLKERKGKKNK